MRTQRVAGAHLLARYCCLLWRPGWSTRWLARPERLIRRLLAPPLSPDLFRFSPQQRLPWRCRASAPSAPRTPRRPRAAPRVPLPVPCPPRRSPGPPLALAGCARSRPLSLCHASNQQLLAVPPPCQAPQPRFAPTGPHTCPRPTQPASRAPPRPGRGRWPGGPAPSTLAFFT